ncbi:MAG: prepilin-type N-terminal cleavage/methylation domain-containing protein, partial [Candidatus Hydrogenedentes bacterium]|nr:prepilin-type N-terminal cleavage/methylation domain-containing protein [Candidatus Hydrogenedentota bacterium]
MYIRRKNDGFSLMELIIATAILALLAGGIAAVFTGSMRAVRAGYQATSANEMARGALNVIERDLSGAFTSRDAGDYYQFFGTPIGMMFVGLVDTDEGTQLARVTYVLHHNAGSDAFETIDAQPVTTYSLVRLIEVGEEDLDSFPGPGWDQWEQAWVPSIDREYPLIAAELNAIRDPAP